MMGFPALNPSYQGTMQKIPSTSRRNDFVNVHPQPQTR
jgi:hypothetical protein